MGLIEARLLPLLVEYLLIELKQINLSNLLVESYFFLFPVGLQSKNNMFRISLSSKEKPLPSEQLYLFFELTSVSF